MRFEEKGAHFMTIKEQSCDQLWYWSARTNLWHIITSALLPSLF